MCIIIYSALHSGKNIKQANHLHQIMKLRTSETLLPQPCSSMVWSLGTEEHLLLPLLEFI